MQALTTAPTVKKSIQIRKPDNKNEIKETKKLISQCEKKISDLETKLNDIDSALSNPETLSNSKKIQQLLIERDELDKELKNLYSEWEELNLKFELIYDSYVK